MATPLGNLFVTDEQAVAQDDVLRKGKIVETLVVEFNQAKYEEFLSSGSKSPKTRICRRVSTGKLPEAQSEALPGADAHCAKTSSRANASQKARVTSGTAVAINRVAQNTRANASPKARVVPGTTAAAINCVAQNTRVNVSQETRVVNTLGSINQDVVGFSPPPRRNRNAERRQRRRARQLQVGTVGCLTGGGRGVQSDALPAPRPVREIRVWRPKRETPQVESSEDQLIKRQGETSAPFQTQEVRTRRRGAQQPALSQATLPKRIRQQRETRVRVIQPRHENRVPEVCVQAEQHMTVSRLRRCETSLFNPPPTDLRDYLTRKRSANQATSSCCCQQLIHMLSGCHYGSGMHQQSLIRQLTLIPPSPRRTGRSGSASTSVI